MSRKKTLDFTPFSQADVNVLLAAVPIVDEKIKAYRVTNWFNLADKSVTYGIQCKIENDWVNMCEGKRALIFLEKKLANAVCRHFKKSLMVAVA